MIPQWNVVHPQHLPSWVLVHHAATCNQSLIQFFLQVACSIIMCEWPCYSLVKWLENGGAVLGKNTQLMKVKLICGHAAQWSPKSMNFLFLEPSCAFNTLKWPVKMACETQPLCLLHTVRVWANSDILETTKFSLLPAMKGGILSVPLTLQPKRRVLPLCTHLSTNASYL